MKRDYGEHEQIYKILKEKGYEGWGGSNAKDRAKGWIPHIDHLVEYMDDKRGDLLELGCGMGLASRMLSDKGFRVKGVDVSETAIEWAKALSAELGDDVEFICTNVCDSEFEHNLRYDVVFDSTCVHCIIDEDRKRLFENTSELLRPDGIFFVNSIIQKNETDKPDYSVVENENISPCARCLVKSNYLEAELENSGFVKVKSWINHREHNDFYSGIFKKV